jgi:co-chaperonin GroES (HSP10)
MQVIGKKLLVRLTRPAERTPGGIWLPDGMRRNLSQGKVIAQGRRLDPWTISWCEEGQVVLFAEHAAYPVTREEVVVYPEDLLGLIMSDEWGEPVLLPGNDWLLIDRDAAPSRSRGGVVLPEQARRAGRSGRVRDVGPGKLLPLGDRLAMPDLAACVVHWSPRAEYITVSSAGEACSLVRAGDVDAVEVEG